MTPCLEVETFPFQVPSCSLNYIQTAGNSISWTMCRLSLWISGPHLLDFPLSVWPHVWVNIELLRKVSVHNHKSSGNVKHLPCFNIWLLRRKKQMVIAVQALGTCLWIIIICCLVNAFIKQTLTTVHTLGSATVGIRAAILEPFSFSWGANIRFSVVRFIMFPVHPRNGILGNLIYRSDFLS